MKIVPVIALFAALVSAGPTNRATQACTPSACTCDGVERQFCGDPSVDPNCLVGHVYSCYTTGETCLWGPSNTCYW
ncbi:hypothetical protein E4T56_gene13246 [Termitomyces sp. T112]|nr:hypothetical protein E4T56_gene13246 [Termitomyces sp. T112]